MFNSRRTFFRVALSIVLPPLLSLTACGFRLRGTVSIPYKTVFITGQPSPQLKTDLERTIAIGTNSIVVFGPKDADLIVDIISEENSRQILTYTSSGQISAFRLTAKVTFRAFDRTGDDVMPESEIYVIRDLDFTTATVLAADIQQQQFLESMRSDLALQILRRIATLGRVSK